MGLEISPVRCGRCGAPLSPEAGASSVRCAPCGVDIPLPGAPAPAASAFAPPPSPLVSPGKGGAGAKIALVVVVVIVILMVLGAMAGWFMMRPAPQPPVGALPSVGAGPLA